MPNTDALPDNCNEKLIFLLKRDKRLKWVDKIINKKLKNAVLIFADGCTYLIPKEEKVIKHFEGDHYSHFFSYHPAKWADPFGRYSRDTIKTFLHAPAFRCCEVNEFVFKMLVS